LSVPQPKCTATFRTHCASYHLQMHVYPYMLPLRQLPFIYLLAFSYPYLQVFTVTHLLTPHSTVLLEKLTGLQLVKKLPTFYETRKFTTAFTSARHLSPS
jgi:hypothetical protein